MEKNSNGGCFVGLIAVVGLCCGAPLSMLLAAPAIAAWIEFSGVAEFKQYQQEWLWASIGSPLLALVLVRLMLSRTGRLRGGSVPLVKRWLGVLVRAAVLLAAVNVTTFVQLLRAGRTDHVIADGTSKFWVTALVGVVVLATIAWWDGRPEPVTVEEVRAAAADADRALRRVRAENERVRRQAEQVQARIAKLRERAAQAGGQAKKAPGGQRQPAEQAAGRSDVDFHSLRTFHRESYQCADTAHLAYQSTQTSLRFMSTVVRRARSAPVHWVAVGRGARQTRAEMRAAATHLARSHSELKVHVDQGLRMVRTLNANTSELKHEIRDSCGEPGRRWFEELEQRIEDARNERRLSRNG
ncbi:hypothetical protein [Catellatospora tritici]|uniref:hypothetical protein n=1 Tax=Catellatospora tritici TaxID=2851566 RepID=UPI001C2D5D6B|nr:hypothetical protein [Catellatospora tritici]MBV1852857.1 hypothetical protein [Catellatospora tritici]